jgi:plasmid stabilization system protein ParE
VTELEAALRILSEQPESAPVFTMRGSRVVRRVILGQSRAHVYYVVAAERVMVLRIWGAVRGRPPALR